MPRRSPSAAVWLLLSWSISSAVLSPVAARAEDAAKIEFFEKKIRPVLVDRCYKCHSDDAGKAKGGLRLDSRAATRRGGESGPGVVPHKPESSLLLEAVRYGSFEMPPDARLSDQVVADFETWIRQGAVDPRDNRGPTLEVIRKKADQIDFAAGRQFWAFQLPEAHPAPPVKQAGWPTSKIDYFTLAAMERQGLTPAAAADRRTLARRVFHDLVGLPPSPGELNAFLSDESGTAYESLVDHLLDSPQFGEKWARLWLDVARFAEDQAHIVGNNKALFFPNAYLYRDWLIGALNDDMPYDEFIRRQLAADMMDEAGDDQMDEAGDDQKVALGFIGLGPKYYRRNDPEVMADEWEDRVDTVSRGLLGLTVACARCHDHKYDPVATEDYYALAGVFASTQMFNAPIGGQPEAKKKGKDGKGKDKDKEPVETMHIVREGKVGNIRVQIRGNVKTLGDEVPRGFLRVLGESEQRQAFSHGSGRLELANAIVDRQNPLAARVFVNRIWGQLFGSHLVSTPSNFGTLGDRPTHPELLDDLAVRFMDEGWSLKRLIREIVVSATYRQSANGSPRSLEHDADNRYLSRMNRRRLTIEGWRDGVLSASGKLTRQVGGKSIDIRDPQQTRRTIYSKVSRFELNPMLAMFDFPDPNVHAARRVETTTALQRLFHLNSPFVVAQSKNLAERIEQQAGGLNERIEFAYELLFARLPDDDERNLAVDFLSTDADDADTDDADAADADMRQQRWQQYAQLLLISNEMLYLD